VSALPKFLAKLRFPRETVRHSADPELAEWCDIDRMQPPRLCITYDNIR